MATATEEAKGVVEETEKEERQELTGIATGTLMGLLVGTFLIVVAIIRGGDAGIFINLNSFLIVIGGTIATGFIAFPSNKLMSMFPVIRNAFKPDPYEPEDYVDDIMRLAAKYRSGGMKQLENAESQLDNRF